MSWAEVKKINDNLSIPLNVANLINHIDVVGTNYTGSGDMSLTTKLINTNELFNHKIALSVVSQSLWDYILNTNTDAGTTIANAFGINDTTLKSYTSASQIMSNATTMHLLGQNLKLQQSLFINPSAYSAFGSASGFIKGMLYSSSVCNWIISSTKDSDFLPISRIRNLAELNTNRVLITTAGTSTYTVPANTYGILAVKISAGGNGSGNGSGTAGGGGGGAGGIGGANGGGGGGGGGYRVKYLSVTPGQVISYTVPASGSNGTCSFYDTSGSNFSIDQNYIIPNISNGGTGYAGNGQAAGGAGGPGSIGGGGGGGGFGGGNGAGYAGNYCLSSGGGGYGGGGGGGSYYSGSYNTFNGGTGGATYGTGGGGGAGTNGPDGGAGGQGVIALYLGKSTVV